MVTDLDNEFPRLLYKADPNGEPVWDLGTFAVLSVDDQAAQDAALADGWALRPDDEPAKPKKPAKPVAVSADV